jgi:hypothetical protein
MKVLTSFGFQSQMLGRRDPRTYTKVHKNQYSLVDLSGAYAFLTVSLRRGGHFQNDCVYNYCHEDFELHRCDDARYKRRLRRYLPSIARLSN